MGRHMVCECCGPFSRGSRLSSLFLSEREWISVDRQLTEERNHGLLRCCATGLRWNSCAVIYFPVKSWIPPSNAVFQETPPVCRKSFFQNTCSCWCQAGHGLWRQVLQDRTCVLCLPAQSNTDQASVSPGLIGILRPTYCTIISRK